MHAQLLAIALLMLASTAAAGSLPEWHVVSNKGGFLIEHRPADGTLYEIRATTHSALAPAAIFETIWQQRDHPQFVPHLKRLDILAEFQDERLVYEQVEIPFARDRDYTVRLHKLVDAIAQRYEVVFSTANDAGPPPARNHIRVPMIRGRWLIEPGPDSKGSKISYELFSDPGSVLPSWLLSHLQGKSVASLVGAMLQRTAERTGRR